MATHKDVDSSILKRLPNPGGIREDVHTLDEFSFLGVSNQPDYGRVRIWIYCKEHIIELKSLKQYKDQYRNIVISYERLEEIMYRDLTSVYQPYRLRLEIALKPRGGIYSYTVKDSDWSELGGTDQIWRSETHPMLSYT